MYKNLDQLSQQISELLYFVLNDPLYASTRTYKFFDSRQVFQIMPILNRFYDLNNLRQTSDEYSTSQHMKVLQQRRESIADQNAQNALLTQSSNINQSGLGLSRNTISNSSNMITSSKVSGPEKCLLMKKTSSVLEFVKFKAKCELLSSEIEIIHGLPTQTHKLQIKRAYKLSSGKELIQESYNIKIELKTLVEFNNQLEDKYFRFNPDLLPRLKMSLSTGHNSMGLESQLDH